MLVLDFFWFLKFSICNLFGSCFLDLGSYPIDKTISYYIRGIAALIGVAKVFAPFVLSLRRNILSPAETYIILKSGPPKQRFDVCPLDGGAGIIALTLPN